MDHTDYRTAALFEHRFWLQVLGDHGRFIYHSLSSNEQQEIDKSLTFIRIFDHLLERSHQDLQVIDIAELNQKLFNIQKNCGFLNFISFTVI